jgi:hypothetical protein
LQSLASEETIPRGLAAMEIASFDEERIGQAWDDDQHGMFEIIIYIQPWWGPQGMFEIKEVIQIGPKS